MSWIDLPHLLTQQHATPLASSPVLKHSDLIADALAFAAGLQQRKVSCIAVYLLDAGDLAVALLGAWRAGVEVILPGDMQPQTQERLSSKADAFFSETQQLKAYFAEPMPAAELDLDAPLLTLSTSGSTAEPKLIQKTLRQLHNEVIELEALWGKELSTNTQIMGSVITQHIFGLLFRLLWPLCSGREFIRQHLPFAEELEQHSLQCVAENRPFVWVTSPALLKRMSDNLNWAQLSRVTQVFSSGGALLPETAELVHSRLQQSVCEIYGSSETGGIAWRKGGQIWQAFPSVALEQQENGALAVRSPWLAGAIEYTNDAVELLDAQQFILQGRLDRIVKLEEKRISLPYLEESLQQHPWVAECRLSVLENGRAYVAALVVLNELGMHHWRNGGRRTLVATLREHLAQFTVALALPRRWRFIEQMPMNAQGKVMQREVEQLLQQERPKLPHVLSAQAEQNEWTFQLRVPMDLLYFSDHFPATPVLPGVVQVDWALHLAQQYLSVPSMFAGMEALKFQQLVRPGDEVQLSLKYEAERGKLYFAFSMQDVACSSGRLLLVEAHG